MNGPVDHIYLQGMRMETHLLFTFVQVDHGYYLSCMLGILGVNLGFVHISLHCNKVAPCMSFIEQVSKCICLFAWAV